MTVRIEGSIPPKLKDFVKLAGVASSKRVFKNGSIELNGRKIQVSSNDDLKSLASKINIKSYATKIEAVVISNGSQEKLLLKSKKSEVNLIDFSGIFKSLYQDEKLGVNKNSLIQVIRDSSYIKPSNVSFNYYVSSKKQSSLNAYIWGELNKFELSRYATNNEVDDAPKLFAMPKVKFVAAHAPLAAPGAMGGAMEVPQLTGAPIVTKSAVKPVALACDAMGGVLEVPLPIYNARKRAALTNTPLKVSAVVRQTTETFKQVSERAIFRKVQEESSTIIETAIDTAMATSRLSEIDPTLRQQLVAEFGNILFSKGKQLDNIRFIRAFQPLAPQISQRLAEAHQSTWAFFSGTSDKLQISQGSIDDIKQWLNTIRV